VDTLTDQDIICGSFVMLTATMCLDGVLGMAEIVERVYVDLDGKWPGFGIDGRCIVFE